MTASVKQVLESFDRLPAPEQREAASEILRRAARFDSPPLDDETLALAAEELFLKLDEQESRDSNHAGAEPR